MSMSEAVEEGTAEIVEITSEELLGTMELLEIVKPKLVGVLEDPEAVNESKLSE